MSMQPKQFVFGPFRIEPDNLRLLRDEKHVHLPPKAFETLVYLIQNTRRLVTRGELMSAIWPDSFVEDANLTVNISLLRKALGELSPGRPYIETVPRKGYRFNADVRAIEGASGGAPSVSSVFETVRPRAPAERAEAPEVPFEPGRGQLAAALARQPSRPELIALPKREPAVSPAGETPVPGAPMPPARGSNLHRYGFLAGLIAALVILAVLAGKFFFRRSPVPAAQMKEVRLTSFAPEMAVTASAVSTGGKFIAYANPAGLFVQVIATGETHTLQLPERHFQASGLSWFPDSAELLLGGSSPHDTSPSLWIVPIIGAGAAVKIGAYPRGAVSPDGSEIAVVRRAGPSPVIGLMRAGVWEARDVARGRPGTIFGSVFWSHDARRMFFVRQTWSADSRENQGEIESYDLASGKTSNVLSEKDLGDGAASLPGGRIVYSKLKGENLPTYYGVDLFETATDRATAKAVGRPVEIAAFAQPMTDLSITGSGRLLVFRMDVTQRSVYVAELDGAGLGLSNLRRLTFGTGRDDYPHAWTRDGKAVYFDSGRQGRWELFKQALDQAAEQRVAPGPDDEYVPQLSPDGAWLLYLDQPKNLADPLAASIMRVPVTGGVSQIVLRAQGIAGWGLRFHCPRVAGAPCVLAQRQGSSIVFRAFDPAKGFEQGRRDLIQLDFDPKSPVDWCLSPDGSRLAWIRFNPEHARIHVLSLARPPSNTGAAKAEPDVVLNGWSDLHSIRWAADGKGWFLTTQSGAQWALIYASTAGRSRVLLRALSEFTPWAVPSPDGRHLAFFQESSSSNVWALENLTR
ncbi:MAG: winged helix-turn-helix domain-containing protein [Terriglobia bacterium]